MLKNAKILLQNEFEKNYEIVKNSECFACYAKEKIYHSFQVLGAGNYILKHEKWFEDKDEKFIDMVKSALVLHDVARFEEISGKFLDKNLVFDHGVMGGEKLSKIEEYSDIRITLPIKHHGHLIEKFYEDEEFQNIADDCLKDQVEKIIFLIRDADKISNINLMANNRDMLENLFMPTLEQVKDRKQVISERCLKDFLSHTLLLRQNTMTQADYILGNIAWVFDINYISSICFLKKLHLFEKLFDILQKFHQDSQLNMRLQQEIKDYIAQKFGI